MEIKILDPVYSVLTDKKLIPMVSGLLSFQAEFYQRVSIKDKYGVPTGKFRQQRKTYPKSMVLPSGMFFTGHVPRVIEYLSGKGILVSTATQGPMETPQFSEIDPDLYPDQAKLVKVAVQARRGLIKAPTGFGKTRMAGALITGFKDIRVLFLCHTITLVHQTVKEFEKLGLKVGYITGTTKKLTGGVIVSTVQSFVKQDQELFDSFDMVIVDECFPQSTKIKTPGGYQNIQSLNIGDYVLTPLGKEKIINTFKNKVNLDGGIVKLYLSNKKNIVCSKDHLFLTNDGWVGAINLKNKKLLTLSNYPTNMVSNNILGGLHYEKRKSLFRMSKEIYNLERWFILFKRLLGKKWDNKKEIIRMDETTKCPTKRPNNKTNDFIQPIKRPTHCPKSNQHQKDKWDFTYLERRKGGKWKRNTRTKNSFIGPWLENRISHPYITKFRKRKKETTWISYLLQSRYRKSRIKNSYRSRWKWTQIRKGYKKRFEEGIKTKRVRVESIEIYKRGSNDQSFSSIIGNKERNQGFVEFYDLEIEKSHTYCIENELIVHNCHHIAKIGGLYFKTLTKLVAPLRYGLTATLPTNEETKLLTEGLIGGVISEFSLKDGIERGFLAVPKIKIIKIPIDYKVKELRKYQDVYDQGVVNNRSRNRMIIKTAKDLAAKGKTSLILITRIEHGENLKEIADLLGLKVCFIQGSDDGEMREMVRGSLNNKEIKTVISTNIWKEGVDIPSLDCIINAAGGKSEIAVLQSIGRGLRATKDKDSVLIVDFLDLSHYYLISHLGERLAIYSENNWL